MVLLVDAELDAVVEKLLVFGAMGKGRRAAALLLVKKRSRACCCCGSAGG